MKPQTFEEWMDEGEGTGEYRHDKYSLEERAAMRVAWQVAHENAALVADYHGAIWVGGAIREQGRK